MALLSVLIVMAGSVGLTTVSQLDQAEQKFRLRKARFAALGGLQLSLLQLRDDAAWPGGSPGLHSLPGWTALPESPGLEYSVRVLNNVDEGAQKVEAAKAPDGSWVPGMSVWVECKGRLKDDEQEFGVVALVSRRRPRFDHAAYAYGPVDLRGGSVVDGFDSTLGAYTPDFDPGNAASWDKNAPIGSDQAISIEAGAAVDGDAVVSPHAASGGTPNIASAGTLSGEELVAERAKMDLDFKRPAHLTASGTDINVPTGTFDLAPGSYRNIDVRAGAVLNLAPGTYYISDTMSLDGAIVQSSGGAENPVIIYVGKSMTLVNGSKVNGGAAGTPRAMELYFTDEDTSAGAPRSTLQMSGHSELSALAAGRFLEATVQNSDVYGALIAVGVVTEGGAAGGAGGHASGIHFDTSIKGRAMNGVASWQVTALRDLDLGELVAGTTSGGGMEPVKPPDYVAFEPGGSGGVTGTTGGGGSGSGGSSSGSTDASGGDSGGSGSSSDTGGSTDTGTGRPATGGDGGSGSNSGGSADVGGGGSSSSAASTGGVDPTGGSSSGSGGGLSGGSGTGGSTTGRGSTGGLTTTTTSTTGTDGGEGS